MFNLSQTTGYAIQALAFIAQHEGGKVFIQNIAQGTGVPAAYLAKIIRRLNHYGMVLSKRGYKGGITLAVKPENLNLFDIYEAMEGPDCLTSCMLGGDSCSDKRDCPTHSFWNLARADIKAELLKTTLADVVTFNNRQAMLKMQNVYEV